MSHWDWVRLVGLSVMVDEEVLKALKKKYRREIYCMYGDYAVGLESHVL